MDFAHPGDADWPVVQPMDDSTGAVAASAAGPDLHTDKDIVTTCDYCGADCSKEHYHAAVSTIPGKQEGDDLCPRHWLERIRSGAPTSRFSRVTRSSGDPEKKALAQTTANRQVPISRKSKARKKKPRPGTVEPTPFQQAVKQLEDTAAVDKTRLRHSVSAESSAGGSVDPAYFNQRGLPLVAKVKNRANSCAKFALAEKAASETTIGCWSKENGECALCFAHTAVYTYVVDLTTLVGWVVANDFLKALINDKKVARLDQT
eukprot:COSAG02_NODE_5979_length_3896_cov_1.628127_3_plen_261_part_00